MPLTKILIGILLVAGSWYTLMKGRLPLVMGEVRTVTKSVPIPPKTIPKGFEFSITGKEQVSVDWLDAVPAYEPCSERGDKDYREVMLTCSEVKITNSKGEYEVTLHNFFISYTQDKNPEHIDIRTVVRELKHRWRKEYFSD